MFSGFEQFAARKLIYRLSELFMERYEQQTQNEGDFAANCDSASDKFHFHYSSHPCRMGPEYCDSKLRQVGKNTAGIQGLRRRNNPVSVNRPAESGYERQPDKGADSG